MTIAKSVARLLAQQLTGISADADKMTIRDFRKFTEQEARAAFNYHKLNKFPRGKCAQRMLTLGWEFNDEN